MTLNKFNVNLLLFFTFICAFIAYLPSLNVPFYLDDFDSIVNNELFSQESISFSSLYDTYFMRVVGYSSFALNYIVSGDDPYFYHLTNVVIHLLAGFFVYKLLGVVGEYLQVDISKGLVIFIVAIWLLHPLNTQAVTYIVQRLASLVALFCFASLYWYLLWRTSDRISYLVLSVVFFGFAFFTKQNAIFLPVFIFLLELTYADIKTRCRLNQLCLVSFLCFIFLYPFILDLIQLVDNATRETTRFTRIEYLNLQSWIHILYVKKFLLIEPLQLNMEPVVTEFQSKISMLMHVLIIGLAFFYRKKVPLIFFGVSFYYISHSIESGLVPITDVAFEHRTYIPNFALSILLATLLNFFIVSMKLPKSLVISVALILCVALAMSAYQRNTQWQVKEAFYKRELSMDPNNPRSLEVIGRYHAQKKEFDLAVGYLTQALNINSSKGKLTLSNVLNLIKAYLEQGEIQKAIMTGQKGLVQIKANRPRSELLSTLAHVYVRIKHCDFAIGLSETALNLNPNNQDAKVVIKLCNSMQR